MILMNDFKADPEDLIREECAAAERVLRSGWFILGSEVKRFEEEWAAFCGVRNAAGTGNGMDALEIGLRASGIGPGDEVITTPMTAFATVLAILRAGATPVLADIDPATALMDRKSVLRCVTSKTRALLPVHLYGQVRDMDKWQALCRDKGLELLEDCAQSHGAKWGGRSCGTFGSWGAFSFYPTKNLGAIGDGGALITDNPELAEKARVLRNYGQSTRYSHPVLGLNSRLDEMQAALLSVRLKRLPAFLARRREIASMYRAGISNPAITLMDPPVKAESHVHHLFVIRCRERDRLMDHLKIRNVESLIHYPVPIHFQEPCKTIRRDPQGLSAAETHAGECLSIPCHPYMTNQDAAQVVEALNAF